MTNSAPLGEGPGEVRQVLRLELRRQRLRPACRGGEELRVAEGRGGKGPDGVGTVLRLEVLNARREEKIHLIYLIQYNVTWILFVVHEPWIRVFSANMCLQAHNTYAMVLCRCTKRFDYKLHIIHDISSLKMSSGALSRSGLRQARFPAPAPGCGRRAFLRLRGLRLREKNGLLFTSTSLYSHSPSPYRCR